MGERSRLPLRWPASLFPDAGGHIHAGSVRKVAPLRAAHGPLAIVSAAIWNSLAAAAARGGGLSGGGSRAGEGVPAAGVQADARGGGRKAEPGSTSAVKYRSSLAMQRRGSHVLKRHPSPPAIGAGSAASLAPAQVGFRLTPAAAHSQGCCRSSAGPRRRGQWLRRGEASPPEERGRGRTDGKRRAEEALGRQRGAESGKRTFSSKGCGSGREEGRTRR